MKLEFSCPHCGRQISTYHRHGAEIKCKNCSESYAVPANAQSIAEATHRSDLSSTPRQSASTVLNLVAWIEMLGCVILALVMLATDDLDTLPRVVGAASLIGAGLANWALFSAAARLVADVNAIRFHFAASAAD